MTFKEVRMVIDAFIDEKERHQKELKAVLYNNAYLTSSFVGHILSGKKIPNFEEVFKEEQFMLKDTEIEDSLLADRMRDFARNANKKFKK